MYPIIFGDMFSSRLNINLREKHGFTYGAHSRYAFRHGPGPFFAGASIRTNVTGQAIAESFKEIDGTQNAPL